MASKTKSLTPLGEVVMGVVMFFAGMLAGILWVGGVVWR